MRKLFTVFTFFLFVQLSADSSFFLIENYLDKYPKEIEKSRDFAKIVKKPSLPLTDKKQKVKIVMLYPGNQVSDYWRRSQVSFEKRMRELKIDYELTGYFTNPQELSKQASLLNKTLNDDVDYLIFTLDANRHAKFIERIINKGKPKVSCKISPLLKKVG